MSDISHKVIAIDPGYDRCGVAVISESEGKPDIIFSTCITTDKKSAHFKRIGFVVESVRELIEKYKPSHLAIETLFFSVNKKTAIQVAEVRGALLALVAASNLELIELSPQDIKIGLTGVGNASKEQVEKMVRLTVPLPQKTVLDDEIDAIAVGVVSLQILRVESLKKGLQRK